MFELPHYFYKLHIYNTCGARFKKKQEEEINRVRVGKYMLKCIRSSTKQWKITAKILSCKKNLMMVKTFLSFRFKFIAPLKFNITDEIEKQNCKSYIPAHISNSYYHTFTIKLTLLLRVKGMKTTHVMFCFCFLWWLVRTLWMGKTRGLCHKYNKNDEKQN